MSKTVKTIKTKEQTVVGVQNYVNPVTGETESFTVINKNISKDYNFHKIWLQDVLNVIDSFGNKKILVITYLLKNMRNEDNTISGSYRDISKASQVSLPTVSLVMKELLNSNVIKKIATATYQFNPDLIMKGGSDKRKNLLIRYNYEEPIIENAKQIHFENESKNPNQTNLLDQIKEMEGE